jgi:lipid A 3-O-deacylase
MTTWIGRMAAATLVLTAATAGAAQAGEIAAGVYAHDLGPADREGGVDIMAQYRTDPIKSWTWLAKPSAYVLASANTQVSTDFLMVGLNWPINLGKTPWYVLPGIGIGYTNGKAGLPPVNAPGLTPAEVQRRLHLYYTRIDFGSHWEFNPHLALGYHLTPKWSVELSYEHLSNGQILHQGKNQGLDDVGGRLVYRFR